jgi:hypothetical protein
MLVYFEWRLEKFPDPIGAGSGPAAHRGRRTVHQRDLCKKSKLKSEINASF